MRQTIDYEISRITEIKLDAIVDMLVAGYAEEYPDLHNYNREIGYQSLLQALNRDDFFMIECSDSEHLMGAFCGKAIDHPFTGKKEAIELFWYVKPEFRKMGLARLIVSQFEVWAKKFGCESIKMTFVDTPVNGEKMERFLSLQGYRKQNVIMIKTLKG